MTAAPGLTLDSCGSRLLNNLALVNAGPPAWAAYADRVREAATAGAARLGSAAPPAPAVAAVIDEAASAARLWAEIAASQTVANPAVDCATARVLLLEYPINGFASAFGLFGGALMQARLRNRILIMDERSGWAYNGGPGNCPDAPSTGQWGCYFRPVGSCTYANAAITDADRQAAQPAHSDGSPTGERRGARGRA